MNPKRYQPIFRILLIIDKSSYLRNVLPQGIQVILQEVTNRFSKTLDKK